ncbi:MULTISPECIES: hypothetical protein [Nostoc]|uniref:Uncharacterized protein n=1 Tax=Nostoc paludosum FACHB-159 TaxID=2692908 RepID=A0ABR8KDM3_9NOSO|nr:MULTISPECIES: hypothetical protein [Nostoc]MBD2681363.1 hypothetical protein [Nostoc sp. FACHB-857]MBD2737125.1 hypothetical protein [Nostoc paludosum FACHB-159]
MINELLVFQILSIAKRSLSIGVLTEELGVNNYSPCPFLSPYFSTRGCANGSAQYKSPHPAISPSP